MNNECKECFYAKISVKCKDSERWCTEEKKMVHIYDPSCKKFKNRNDIGERK